MSNREQLSTDALSTQTENELICEKLLGWHRCLPGSKGFRNGYQWQEDEGTPDFISWAEAGLILDVLFEKHHEQLEELKLEIDGDLDWKFVLQWDSYEKMVVRYSPRSGPAAIRAGALEYIRSLP